VALLALGCSQQAPVPADTRAADEAALRDADIAWSRTSQAKQLDQALAYYADDASTFPPNAPIATGKEAITNLWTQMYQTPGFSLNWQPVKVEVAQSGDLGYTYGTYQLTMNDPAGNPVTDRGKYITVWKKQADGSWKSVADMFNSDLPPPAPAK
jgi:ketosteroid isomerase-like protein